MSNNVKCVKAKDEHCPRLAQSPHLDEIDELLLGYFSIAKIRNFVKREHGEEYGTGAFTRRRICVKRPYEKEKAEINELAARKGAIDLKVFEADKKAMAYELKTIGETAQSILDLDLPETDKNYEVIRALKQQLHSFLRRSSELFEDVDHLANLRYSLNLMQVRISMLFEMELRTGIVMRENTVNINTFVDLLVKSIELHQLMGLKPKFGDPATNIPINSSNRSGEPTSERHVELQKKLAVINTLPEDQQAAARLDLLRSIVPFPMNDSSDTQPNLPKKES